MSKDKLLRMLQESEPESEPEPIKENKTNKVIRKENFDAEKRLRDIRTILEPEEYYYRQIKVVNACDDNYIGY